MSTTDSKSKYIIFILIGLGILICAVGIALYMMRRKMSSTEIKLATTSKTSDDLRVSMAKLEQEIKSKNEKMQDLQKDMLEIRNENTRLAYEIKALKKSNKKSNRTCDDSTCTTSVEPIA